MENVHFVMRGLDFPCIPFEYKDNTMEIQWKCNGNPSHARKVHVCCQKNMLNQYFLSRFFFQASPSLDLFISDVSSAI